MPRGWPVERLAGWLTGVLYGRGRWEAGLDGEAEGKGGPSQSGSEGIVYELDTLPHQVGGQSAPLSLVISGACANQVHTATTEQCQVATGPVWDDPGKGHHEGCPKLFYITEIGGNRRFPSSPVGSAPRRTRTYNPLIKS